jgi:hypothetical protein
VNGAGAGVDEEVFSELFGYAAGGWGGGLVGMVGGDEGRCVPRMPHRRVNTSDDMMELG